MMVVASARLTIFWIPCAASNTGTRPELTSVESLTGAAPALTGAARTVAAARHSPANAARYIFMRDLLPPIALIHPNMDDRSDRRENTHSNAGPRQATDA